VTWPTKEQAALLTGLVIGVSLVVGVYLGLLDFGFSQGYRALLKATPDTTTDTSGENGLDIAPEDITVETVPADSSDSSSQQ
jgi:preprotein translocase SecE subunit